MFVTRRGLAAGLAATAAPHIASTAAGREALVRSFDTVAALEAADLSGTPADAIIATRGYHAPADGGGAVYSRVDALPQTPGWVRSADGTYWDLREEILTPRMFGARAAGTDDSEAIQACFDRVAAQGGGMIYIPGGDAFHYARDIRLLGSNVTLQGAGPTSGLMPMNNARLVLGSAEPRGLAKAGTKVSHTIIRDLRIQPTAEHRGECVLLDFADQTRFVNSHIGPSDGDPSNLTVGVRCNWCQWTYFEGGEISVSDSCVVINLSRYEPQNEDHIHFDGVRLYIGKPAPPGHASSCVRIIKEEGNRYGLFELSLNGCHLGNFSGANSTRHAAGLSVVSRSAGPARAIHTASISGCFFEALDSALDLTDVRDDADTSRLVFSGCSFLGGRAAFLGAGVDKCAVVSVGNFFLQMDSIALGVRTHFVAGNRAVSVSRALPDGIAAHLFADKEGGALDGVRLLASRVLELAPGVGRYRVVHGLSLAPDHVSCSFDHDVGSHWVSDVDERGFTLNVRDAPRSAMRCFWRAERVQA
jgi:hypothetical protein